MDAASKPLWSTPSVTGVPQVHLLGARFRGYGGLGAEAQQCDLHGRQINPDPPGGRPCTDAIQIETLQDELRDFLQTAHAQSVKPKQDPECIAFVRDRLAAYGWKMGTTTILRDVVRPVHQAIWPRE
jgi:hypothetical protein